HRQLARRLVRRRVVRPAGVAVHSLRAPRHAAARAARVRARSAEQSPYRHGRRFLPADLADGDQNRLPEDQDRRRHRSEPVQPRPRLHLLMKKFLLIVFFGLAASARVLETQQQALASLGNVTRQTFFLTKEQAAAAGADSQLVIRYAAANGAY